MSNSDEPINKTWHNVFFVGQAVIIIAGFIFLKDLSLEFQPIGAIASSVAWFTSSFLYSKIPDKTGKSKFMPSLSFWMGVAEAILAILFWTVFEPKTTLAIYGKMFNMLFVSIGFAILYSSVFFFRFPSLFKAAYPPPLPDPIAELPSRIQTIVNDGRIKIFKISAISLFVFIGAGALLPFLFRENPIIGGVLWILESILALIIVAILRTWTARKWQEEALKSGIPKDILEEAAKLGGIPWPKIKEE